MAKGGEQVGAWYSLGSRGRGRRGLNARFRASKLNESSRAEETFTVFRSTIIRMYSPVAVGYYMNSRRGEYIKKYLKGRKRQEAKGKKKECSEGGK
jgi:hypothetical protein